SGRPCSTVAIRPSSSMSSVTPPLVNRSPSNIRVARIASMLCAYTRQNGQSSVRSRPDPSAGQHLAAKAFRPGAAEPSQSRGSASDQQQDRSDRTLDLGALADGPCNVGGGEPEPSD